AADAIALAGGLVTTTDGDLVLDGDVELDGEGDQAMFAGVAVDEVGRESQVTGDLVKTTAGDLALTADAVNFNGEAGDQVASVEDGALDIDAELKKTTDGDLTVAAADGIFLEGNGSTASGDLVFADDVELDGAGDQVMLAGADGGAGTLHFQGRVDKTVDGNLEIGGADGVVLDGHLTNDVGGLLVRDDLTVTGAALDGRTRITANGMDFQGDVTLENDARILDPSDAGIRFLGAIDGNHELLLETNGNMRIDGSIGADDPLARFETRVHDGFLLFGGSQIAATGDVLLNWRVDLPGVPDIATMGAVQSLLITGANYRMGSGQKLTVLGDLTIDVGDGTALLSDLNTLGDMTVTAGQIGLVDRPAGQVLTADGRIVDDLGVDFVAGGVFNFSVEPNGQAIFASPGASGDVVGTLRGLSMRSIVQLIVAALRQGATFFDLAPSGSGPFVGPTTTNPAEARAAIAPLDSELELIETSVVLDPASREELARRLDVRARALDAREAVLLGTGLAMYYDSEPTSLQDVERGRGSWKDVNVHRLVRPQVMGALEAYRDLVPVGTVEEESARTEAVRTTIGDAWDAFEAERGEDPDPSGFYAFVESSGRTEAASHLRQIGRLMACLDNLGPTKEEIGHAEDLVRLTFTPDGMDPEQLDAAVKAVPLPGAEQ
ncbi:MAG: hypothetical protein ACYTJ0_14165, partial [Planctomycetota bacterium]